MRLRRPASAAVIIDISLSVVACAFSVNSDLVQVHVVQCPVGSCPIHFIGRFSGADVESAKRRVQIMLWSKLYSALLVSANERKWLSTKIERFVN